MRTMASQNIVFSKAMVKYYRDPWLMIDDILNMSIEQVKNKLQKQPQVGLAGP